MLSVITSLEFFQHYFAKMGHRNTSCDPHLHQAIEQPMLPTSREASAARTATSKRAYRRSVVDRVSLWGVVANVATEVSLQKNPNAVFALLWAGFACGVLDITAALVVYGFFGLKPMRLLQGIASGLLGSRAFSGGLATALLGLLCHFLIAFGPAAVYLLASRALGFLIDHAVISGFLYCVAGYFFM